MDYKNGKWAKKIIELQHDDGSWGYFHSLSNPTPKQPITTEQALRRLEILGFTIEDKPIKKAVKYMNDCLIGKNRIPDREEKLHNWNIFTSLMLSTRIKIFTKENETANCITRKWCELINKSFSKNGYDHEIYVKTYEKVFETKINHKAGRLIDFVNYYPVSLLTNELDKNSEPYYFEYILNHNNGIYYIYNKKLTEVPKIFKSKDTNNYLRAIELLVKYDNPECKNKLKFIVKWLKENMVNENEWDMGKESKDNINFPLSDSWRNDENRIKDCTYRISKILGSCVE
ncbi:MAG: hypothetical protein FWH17_10620 [Oscillospiraceae bacterium]|nr:hypothetical protein [Oscillospiraceae bacterium]